MNPLLEAALEYQAQGYTVVPCEPRGKKPLIEWRNLHAQPPTRAQIEQYWGDWPEANVALVMGQGMWVLDVDGSIGYDELKSHLIDIPPDTPTCLTGKGAHYYFKGNQPDRIGLLEKVDVKGRGIVVVPPSVHASGSVYSWVTPLTGVSEAPAPIASLLRKAQAYTEPEEAEGPPWLTLALQGVGEGMRNATCTRIAGYLLGKGMPKDAVLETLRGWSLRCDPPMATHEIASVVESISTREGAHTDEVKTPETLNEVLTGTLQSIRATRDGKAEAPIHTGLRWLDEMLDGGLFSNDYIILGARPGIGKTALALQIIRAAAAQGHGVLFISREMSRRALARRMICQESKVPLSNLKRGDLHEENMRAVEAAASHLSTLPIWLSDNRTITEIMSTVNSFAPGVLGLLVVDYLQLVRSPMYRGVESRQAVEHVSQELLQISNNVCPVLCLSSLSRPPRDVKDYKPGMGDLRESGELEHDADIVWLLSREEGSDTCDFRVVKNREGRVGWHRFKFEGQVLTFTDQGWGSR